MSQKRPVPWKAVTRNWAGQLNRGYVRAMQTGTDEANQSSRRPIVPAFASRPTEAWRSLRGKASKAANFEEKGDGRTDGWSSIDDKRRWRLTTAVVSP
ncbi:uncharacterized protein LY79DRAFT_352958 [Colletotrichum navitas]|uniref:Uncharacterized protein n=1 Tax=Colletotrichum navitas TaxID=681940 RepID=A0AAD8Q827_9PEZI|nr:uncharacterized protein LY79DRAFT_352958 [Colletotrichum navitas]KAK1597675.1 hypothetical protein LY79DRAFT_352958 [Colletotrichum navitas]